MSDDPFATTFRLDVPSEDEFVPPPPCPLDGTPVTRIERWIGPPDAQTLAFVEQCQNGHIITRSG